MEIKFDAMAALQLIRQMDIYCSGIVKETKGLLAVAGKSHGWQDNQSKAFRNNITALAVDLNTALSLESEYIRIFHQRVTELRG